MFTSTLPKLKATSPEELIARYKKIGKELAEATEYFAKHPDAKVYSPRIGGAIVKEG